MAQQVKNPLAIKSTGDNSIPGSGRSLVEERAIHSSILAWRIPLTEGPGATVPRVAKTELSSVPYCFVFGCQKAPP